METVKNGKVYGEIKRFDGGIVYDPRDPRPNTARVVTNFDILTSPRRMTPYWSSTSGDDAPTTSKKQNFCIALQTGTTYGVYALGVKSGATTAEVLYKNILVSGSSSFINNTWANTGNHQSASNATWFQLFVYYQKQGFIYGAKDGATPGTGRYIWRYDPSGSAAFSETYADLTSFSNLAQGLVHSKDDILYIPYDNKIAKDNNGSFTVAALTLPSHLYITSISEYGNFLAIACAPRSGVGNSRVYLWDRDATLATLSETVDWGSGILNVLEEVDGFLIGISRWSSFIQDRIIVRYLSGNKALPLLNLKADGVTASALPIAKQKVDNRLYFMLNILLNGSALDGVFSIGRSSPAEPFTLIHERTPNNDTALSGRTLYSFILVKDILLQSYLSNGSENVTITDYQNVNGTFSHTSIYESKKFDGGDSSLQKDLMGVTVHTEYLPSGSVTLKYRIDQNTSWTSIFTNSTVNSISYSVVKQSGLLPSQYKEIQFRIESTGGPEITGLSWLADITSKKPY